MKKNNDRFFFPVPNGIECRLRVSTKASANKIGKPICDDQGQELLKISVTAIPEHGKANAKVIELLVKEWRLNKSQIEIKKGAANRDKLIHIAGDPNTLIQFLTRIYPER